MKKTTKLTAIVLAALAISTTQAAAEGDAAAGEKVFKSKGCQGCHTVAEGGAKKVGPNLWGIFGSTAGTREVNFKFSKAMAKSDIVWTEESLNDFFANPKKLIKGTRMPFRGLPDENARDDLVAYLKSVTQ